jgi:hypothetical protein
MKANGWRILGAIVAITIALPAAAQQGTPAMPVSQQNALVQKYCAVCHSETKMMGGLSLEVFDAEHPDPSVAAMMVNKLNSGAMGAAGIPIPDSSVVSALTAALSNQAADAAAATGGWTFKAFNDPLSKVPLVTATIVREVPSTRPPGESSVYQLTVTCQKNSDVAKGGNAGEPAEMHITTYTKGSSGLAPRPMSGPLPITYEVDGRFYSGVASNGQMPMTALPAKTLAVCNLFPGEAVMFPFGGLNDTLRRVLSTCVGTK